MISNRTLGERCHEAIVEAAKRKTEALRLRKLAERTYDRVFLSSEGKNIAEREAKARVHVSYLSADDAALEAESEAIVAKAEADGMQVRFEEWRSRQATDRAEMQLR